MEEEKEKIEQYLSGALTGSALDSFEQELLNNPMLADELQLRREVNDSIQELQDINDLRHKFQTAKEEASIPSSKESSSQKRPPWRKGYFSTILVVLLLITLAIILLNRSFTTVNQEPVPTKVPIEEAFPDEEDQKETEQDLFKEEPIEKKDQTPRPIAGTQKVSPKVPANQSTSTENRKELLAFAKSAYFAPDLSTGRRSDGKVDQDTLAPAFRLITTGKLVEALTFLEDFGSSSEFYFRAQELKASIFFQIGQYDKAEIILLSLYNSKLPSFTEKAEWNLVLVYIALGQNNSDQLNELLESILKDEGHPANANAKSLKQNHLK